MPVTLIRGLIHFSADLKSAGAFYEDDVCILLKDLSISLVNKPERMDIELLIIIRLVRHPESLDSTRRTRRSHCASPPGPEAQRRC